MAKKKESKATPKTPKEKEFTKGDFFKETGTGS